MLAERTGSRTSASIALTMPDPKKLEVGDRIRFVSLPEEWHDAQFTVHPETVEFMNVMISRTWPSRVFKIDEFGTPWIDARIRRNGRIEYHSWGIYEETGWRVVRRRS